MLGITQVKVWRPRCPFFTCRRPSLCVVKECTLPVDPVLCAVTYATPPGLFIANAAYTLRPQARLAEYHPCLVGRCRKKMPISWPPIYHTPTFLLLKLSSACPRATLKIWRQSTYLFPSYEKTNKQKDRQIYNTHIAPYIYIDDTIQQWRLKCEF